MNQILYKKIKLKNNVKKFKIMLYISLVLIIILCFYSLWFYNNIRKKEKLSKDYFTSFNIDKVYYTSNDEDTSQKIYNENYTYIIGIIEIPKINIKYPILSSVDDELLKIAPCRFYGPLPNEIGNLCIAGHNYDDDRFFGNIFKLETNDKITIYDSKGSYTIYSVYKKYEISANDISCTNQNTFGKKEITLVTCNNKNKNRLVIKARE